ncbi:DUF6089 family protein [uncultured Formosa sp.]|uniref:type IX secretion system protein PorG n=1 Tax=uncultured Formosa sp. TaxID=255435 RepID=UPI002602AB68|nr:DUF6089 family protein [uncultured Formosa sp.]
MKYILVLIISLFCLQSSYSQIHEFGVFLGGSNLIGDVGEPSFINPNQFAIGGIYKWNKSSRHSWRVSGIMTELQISEDEPTKTKTVGELSAGLEFNFFEFDLHHSGAQSTPYIYTGLSVLNHTNEELKKKWALALPMILGYKFRLNRSFNIGAEVGARFSFSDDLDGSDELGNLNNNDWYVFTGLTLTYTFGRNPCYCTN